MRNCSNVSTLYSLFNYTKKIDLLRQHSTFCVFCQNQCTRRIFLTWRDDNSRECLRASFLLWLSYDFTDLVDGRETVLIPFRQLGLILFCQLALITNPCNFLKIIFVWDTTIKISDKDGLNKYIQTNFVLCEHGTDEEQCYRAPSLTEELPLYYDELCS